MKHLKKSKEDKATFLIL